jgi:ABC-2 type transport system permease protein
MNSTLILAVRALKETQRSPDALFPALFIPLFFLVVNTGQAARIFPSSSTEFLRGQNYAAFQMPSTLLLAASFGAAALFLVEEIEGGYFDKLRATPIPRYAIILGRLLAEGVRTGLVTAVIVLLAIPFGVTVASGVAGFLLLILLTGLWGVVYSGFLQMLALKTRSAAATQAGGMVFFPLLFLTPNFVPRELLTDPMEVAATINPVTYLMEALRSLYLQDLAWSEIWPGFAVVLGAAAVMLVLSVRMINRYD